MLTQVTVLVTAICLTSALSSSALSEDRQMKSAGVLFPAELISRVKANAARSPWAASIRDSIVRAAEPWRNLSDDALWSEMFGPGITRSWMVWSNGTCPSCKKDVGMYSWEMDPLTMPWKVRCPHCKETFPKNDFGKYYLSGLDGHSVFDAKRADRSLLFNTDHPDPSDALHHFGVDDGEGYTEGDKRWRFIGAYLVYGQWKQMVLGGINRLAAAYVVTGDQVYAHKAAVMLDRVADLYPGFDYSSQGLVYEKPLCNGYVSVWHDACEETRQLAIAYDWVFDGIKDDKGLVTFLAEKSSQYKPDNPKTSFADIQRNIEGRILRDALANRPKIESNYPRTDIAIAVIKTALGWPGDKEEVMGIIDGILTKATAVDGVTGEKGLANYSAFAIAALGGFLAQYTRVDPDFLKEEFKRHPRLAQTFRFHIDTWCMGEYYPLVGDTGWFGRRFDQYQGVSLVKPDITSAGTSVLGLDPSMFKFMWDLYEITGDTAYVQALYRGNDGAVSGLPYDMTSDDPVGLEKKVAEVIKRVGADIPLASVNKQEWHLAILRSGKGKDRRALWLNYESGGQHGHCDGMNLGLFAKGLDLLPDFGYPPVNFGGWESERALWYRATSAHNTVTVDGQNLITAAGKSTLWADGESFHAVRASAPAMVGGIADETSRTAGSGAVSLTAKGTKELRIFERCRYERTAALVDISEHDCYVLDVFRVAGGAQHDKFTGSSFGSMATNGIAPIPAADYGHGAQIRNLCIDESPKPGWSVDWKIEDRYKYLPDGADVHMRYTDLTTAARGGKAEAWVTYGGYWGDKEAWIPRVLTRRTGTAPLTSTFVSVLEPYEKGSNIASVRRLPMGSDSDVAVEIDLIDGRRDLIVARDPERASEQQLVSIKDWDLSTDCDLCMVRLGRDGVVERVALCGGRYVGVGHFAYKLDARTDFVEVVADGGEGGE